MLLHRKAKSGTQGTEYNVTVSPVFIPLYQTEKKKSDINTSAALISHFDRTLLVELTVAA